jgi:hypothetical protein
MPTDKHLKLRAADKSALGRVIAHIQEQPVNNQELASATLQARFLPFVMDKNDPHFREVAIRCATECEAMAKAIREYAGLNSSMVSELSSFQVQTGENHSHLEQHQEDVNDDEEKEKEEIDPELEERKKQRRNSDLGF